MNVLEKILEEIEEKIKFAEKIIVKPPCDKLDEIANDTAEAFIEAYKGCVEIIRSHMDHSGDDTEMDSWIPVGERLPEPYKLVEVTVHCSEWISDYDSVWAPENEKIHYDEEYLSRIGYMDKDGDWIFYDKDGCEIYCDKEFGADKTDVYNVVTAWQPLPEPYKGGE